MRLAGRALLVGLLAGVCLVAAPGAGLGQGRGGGAEKGPRLITDGRLRPGHLETMRVAGFPGAGDLQVSFFPTAICEDECSARTFSGGRTDVHGNAWFRVRVPGTFFDNRDHPVYFRNGERVEVEVTWEGSGHRFDVASAEPVIVRSHRAHATRSARPVAHRSDAATTKPLPVPGGFRLQASNGYTLLVVAVPPREHRGGSVQIIAAAKGRAVYYTAPAAVTETSIQSDLGQLGEISLNFQRSGRAATAPCGKEKVHFDSGQYEGKFEFHGEEGFTEAEVTAVPGNIDYLLSAVCGEPSFGGGSVGRGRGAQLSVRNPALGPELGVHKSKPGAAAQITASMSEYGSGISIERYVALRTPGADFTYDRHLRTATIRPPPPFAGSAHFDRAKEAGQRWSGDLAVDFPGRADVPLTGSSLRATLTPSE